MRFAIVLVFLLNAGCALLGGASQVTVKTPLYQYKPDIEIGVDGKTFEGMAVTSLGPKQIKLVSKAKLDLLMISSCHRNFTVERAGYKKKWFGLGGSSAAEYIYEYTPTAIESEGVCPLYIQAFSVSGVTAWGYIAFRTEETLPSKTECNGTNWTFSGISVCASRAGFEQGIHFDTPVKFIASELCEVVQKTPGDFRLRTKKGFCYATFSDGTKIHRLILLGYDEALIRGE